MKSTTALLVIFLLSHSLFGQGVFEAIENKDYNKLKELITKEKLIEKKNSDGITPLWKATLEEDTLAMKVLLNGGANPNNPTRGGATPIFLPCSNGFVESAIILCRYGANVNFNNNKYSLTPLRNASRNGQLEVVKLLVDQGATIDARAEDMATPLTIACAKGHLEVVEFLIDRGADVNAKDKDGDTPLNNACSQGRIDVVKLLLTSGADKEIKNIDGKSAVDYAKYYGFPEIVDLLNEEYKLHTTQCIRHHNLSQLFQPMTKLNRQNFIKQNQRQANGVYTNH